ncbi:MAG: hypothetical protein ACOZE5_09190 [Verrucomicrobiota bacterium]
MNAAPLPTVAAEINRLHSTVTQETAASRAALNGAITAAWQAGHLLTAEKKRVRRTMGAGAWLLWLEANFRGTPRTAQRYMKLARSVADVAFLQGMSLRQAYARLGIATESKERGVLKHRLPSHLMLANKLMRALKRAPGRLGPGSRENFRRDLRPLYEALHPLFAGPEPQNAG